MLSFLIVALALLAPIQMTSKQSMVAHANDLFQRNQPTLLWEKTFGGSGDDRGVQSVHNSYDNTIITVGTSIEMGQFNTSIYVLKIDLKGTILWERNYGSRTNNHASSILINHRREIIVCFNSMDVAGGQSGANNIAILRLDFNGDLIEEIPLFNDLHQYASKIKQLDDHSYVLIGSTFDEATGLDEIFYTRLNQNFKIITQKIIEVDVMISAHDIIHDSRHGFFLLTTAHASRGIMRMRLHKLDFQGEVLWTRTYGERNNYMACSIIETYDDHLLIMGETDAFGNEVGISMFKIDLEGNIKWEKFHSLEGNTIGRSIIETCNHGFLITGATNVSLDDMLYSDGKSKGFLLFTDSFGNKLWDRTFGGNRHDFFLNILVLSDDSYVLTGRSSSFSRNLDMDLYMIHLDTFIYNYPVMSIYPNKIYFGVVERNSLPLYQMVYISNDGLGNLSGYITLEETWIVSLDQSFIIPTFGFLALPINLDTTQMSEGNYSGKITLVTNGGNASIEVHCSIIDNAPFLKVVPEKIDFGSITQRKKITANLQLLNEGRKNLFGQISSSESWIELSHERFFSNDFELDITINPSQMRNGKHQGKIIIQSSGGNMTIEVAIRCDFPVIVLILTIGKAEALVNNQKVLIDASNPQVVPVILDGRTLVPLRFLSEIFGAQVHWNAEHKTIYMQCEAKEISILLQVNNNEAVINDHVLVLDVPPMIIENRVFVPLRFLAESFGADVAVDQSKTNEAMKIIIHYEV